MAQAKGMLVFHSAYTFDDIKKLGLEIFVLSRDSGNFFERILTVSPVASLQYQPEDPRQFSAPECFHLDERNIILEGRLARFRFLKRLKVLNFIVAQGSLIFKLVRKGKIREIELIRGEDPRFNGIYAYLVSRILQRPLVIGLWGNPGRIRKLNGKPIAPRLFRTMNMEEKVETFILKRADLVLAQNSENMSYALQVGVAPEKTRITPLGIGIDKVHFLPLSQRLDVSFDLKTWQLEEKFLLICISRLEAIKMVNHAISACKVLKDAHIPFNLVLVGEGRERKNLEELAGELGLAENVIFMGNRSQEWIAGLMAHVDLNIAPLCGRALLEASLSGCPAVSYDVDWHGEIVHSGVTGELVENLDFEAMGEEAKRILLNDQLRSSMRKEMLKLSHDLASPTRIVEEQVKIYSDLIQKRRKNQPADL
jgi:glycosyltransferase involved in cell wall biosynthesis